MRTSVEIIEHHLNYMRAGAYAATTIYTAGFVLGKINRELPHGLACASEEELISWFANPDWKVKTKATYHLHVTRFLRWASSGANPWISYDPSVGLARPKPPKGLPHPPADDVVRRCVNEAKMPFQLACRCAAYAGLRAHEIAKLRREDVTVDRITVIGKGGKERWIPTHPRIWELVEPLPAGLLVKRPGGQQYGANALSSAVSDHLNRHLGLNTTLHPGRHWFATKQIEGGTNLRTVQELMGHASPATTAIYTQVSDQLRQDAVAGLPDLIG